MIHFKNVWKVSKINQLSKISNEFFKVPVIRDILKIKQIVRDSWHFEVESIMFYSFPKLIIGSQFWNIWTTFWCLSPYVRIKKLGWEIYDFFPWPPPLSKISLGNFWFSTPCWEIFPSFTLWLITMASLSLM